MTGASYRREGTNGVGPASPRDWPSEQFLEFAPDAIIGVDREGTIVLVNEQAKQVFGYSREELLAPTSTALLPERFGGCTHRHREGYFEDPRTRAMGAELNLYGLRKGGDEFPAEISLSSIETDEGILAIAAVRDISDRRHAERKFEQFLEFAPDAIVGVCRDWRHRLGEPAGRGGLSAIPAMSWSGSPSRGWCRSDSARFIRRTAPATSTDPRTRPWGRELELYGLRKDGSEFPAEISLSSIETEDGDPRHGRCTRHQPSAWRPNASERFLTRPAATGTQRKAREHRDPRRRRRPRLQQHPHRDHGARRAAEDRGRPQRARRRRCRHHREGQPSGGGADAQAARLRPAGKAPERPVDVHGTIQEVIGLLGPTLDKNIEIQCHFADDRVFVLGDPGQVEQVLLNLAVNARDAMPQGGVLSFSTSMVELDEDDTRKYNSVAPGRYLMVAVADTGTGIPGRRAGAHLRALLHDQGGGQGHRHGPRHGVRHRAADPAASSRSTPRSARAPFQRLPAGDARRPPRQRRAPGRTRRRTAGERDRARRRGRGRRAARGESGSSRRVDTPSSRRRRRARVAICARPTTGRSTCS